MSAMLASKLVLILCFVGLALAQFDSICNYDCIATDVYGPYCGGAVCVHGETDPSQHEALCSQGCADAILGKPLRKCVYSQNPRIRNLVAETRNMVTFIKAFCDRWDVEHNIVVPPHPAPAPEVTAPPADVPEPVEVPEASKTILDILEKDIAMDPPAPAPVPPSVAVPTAGPIVPPMTMDPPPVASMPQAAPVNHVDGDNDAIDDLNEI